VRMPCIVSLPGVTAPGSRSDALIQSEDFYPTLLEALALKPAPDQSFDGISILPALRGEALSREAIFQYFPHDPGVPDWLPPAVSVHRGDWKLIRLFHGGDHGAHRYLLFNLQDDPGEKNNLAATEPARVAELDALIGAFLAKTHAVVPIPNPAFDPSKYHPELEGKAPPKAKPKAKAGSAAQAPAQAGDDPALQGWKARGCQAHVAEGLLTVTPQTNTAFLGVAAGRLSGPAEVRFRCRRREAGNAKIEWLPSPGAVAEARSVPYQIQGGDWEEITVSLPATGPLGIVRLYVPGASSPITLDWIELRSGAEKRRTDF